jgi:hypothetical protein
MPALVVNKEYDDTIPPTSAQFDAAFSSIETFFNITGFGADNLADGLVSTTKLADSAITETKLGTAVVTPTELADLSITKAKLTLAAILLLLEPTGTIDGFAGDTVPAGYLLCDGAAVSRTTYSDLFAITGIRFGNGNGTTTFNVPDFRGRFLRAADNGAGRDPEAANRTAMSTGGAVGNAVGSLQTDDFILRQGTFPLSASTLTPPPRPADTGPYLGTYTPVPTGSGNDTGTTSRAYQINRPGSIFNVDPTKRGLETRPISMSVLWLIKT